MLARFSRRLASQLPEALATQRPGGHIRRGVLLVGVLAVLMVAPLPLSPASARVVADAGLLIIVLSLALAVGSLRRLAYELAERAAEVTPTLGLGEQLTRGLGAFDGVFATVRRVGLACLGLAFFLTWTLIFCLLWTYAPEACSPDVAQACHGAFRGAGQSPHFGDFLYLAVNMAFANPPADLLPASRLADTAASLEVISGIALASLYAGAFFGFSGHEAQRPGV